MATLEELKVENKDLKENNNELAQKVQYWKMTAAQKDDEKLDLIKEINELRLKLSRLRNNGGFQARKLDTALQDASKKAMTHLVNASNEIARGMEIAKVYIREQQELDAQSPRWSSIGGTPTEKRDRVHRVPPMMMGGQSIQPVVALSRTVFNTSHPRSTTRSPNQNRSLIERAVPMHMLQDVYIPLTRIDISDLRNNNMGVDMDVDVEANNAEDSPEEFLENSLTGDVDILNDSEGSQEEEYDVNQLETVSEEELSVNVTGIEPPRLQRHIDPRQDQWHRPDSPRDPIPTKDKQPKQSRENSSWENPLEGPSWLLDDTPTNSVTPPNSKKSAQKGSKNHEPDSTTEVDKTPKTLHIMTQESTQAESGATPARAFSPTVRRRKRTSSPLYSPRPGGGRRGSINGRVLKVLVAKMRLDSPSGEQSPPPKRARSPPERCFVAFDAPSPNGATDSRVIVSETRTNSDIEITIKPGTRTSRLDTLENQRARVNSQESETQRRSRLTLEHEAPRTTSEHERRSHSQDERESQHRSRLTDQESRDSAQPRQRSRLDSRDSRDSDSGSGDPGGSISGERTRRPRKAVTYKEKPLNRKMRR